MHDFNWVHLLIVLAVVVAPIALFSFLSVATWSGTRFAEREAYYKSEMMKKIAEVGGNGNAALEYLREEDRLRRRNKYDRRKQGLKIGGMINIAVGIALFATLHELVRVRGVALEGLFPLLIGVALLIYVFAMMPPFEP
jgi:hypothetical protein